MTGLRDLYLEQNVVEYMPDSLTCLTTLVLMRLSANRLKALPDVGRMHLVTRVLCLCVGDMVVCLCKYAASHTARAPGGPCF